MEHQGGWSGGFSTDRTSARLVYYVHLIKALKKVRSVHLSSLLPEPPLRRAVRHWSLPTSSSRKSGQLASAAYPSYNPLLGAFPFSILPLRKEIGPSIAHLARNTASTCTSKPFLWARLFGRKL
jgi:hypothetical protein